MLLLQPGIKQTVLRRRGNLGSRSRDAAGAPGGFSEKKLVAEGLGMHCHCKRGAQAPANDSNRAIARALASIENVLARQV